MSISIKDVAREAGVSIATVSRVLSRNPAIPIADETRATVLRVADELRYRPSSVARALVRPGTPMLGVVLPPDHESAIRDPFFGALFDGVLSAAAKRAVNIAVFTGQSWVNAQRSLTQFRDGRCDGLLLFYQPESSDIVQTLLDAHVPIVLLSQQNKDSRLTVVDVDNHAAALAATRHLLDLGHRRIGLLCDNGNHSFTAERYAGYHAALESAGVPVDGLTVSFDAAPWNRAALETFLAERLALPLADRPTAFFCLSDALAVLVISLLSRLSVRVPQDVSVVGFNDDGSAANHDLALTTISQPFEELAGTALDLLSECIGNVEQMGQIVRVPAELIVRDSTAAPHG